MTTYENSAFLIRHRQIFILPWSTSHQRSQKQSIFGSPRSRDINQAQGKNTFGLIFGVTTLYKARKIQVACAVEPLFTNTSIQEGLSWPAIYTSTHTCPLSVRKFPHCFNNALPSISAIIISLNLIRISATSSSARMISIYVLYRQRNYFTIFLP